MPPARPAPGTPQDWLKRARAKLALARSPLPPGGVWEDLCYMAQQTAEVAIKAVYMQHAWLFPYVHDLEQLLNGLQAQGLTIPAEVQEADQLSDYAVETRYPGLSRKRSTTTPCASRRRFSPGPNRSFLEEQR